MLQPFGNRFEFRAKAGLAIDDQRDQIGILGAAPCRLHHRTVEPPLGREDAGRIDQHELRLALYRHAEHTGARRLRLGAGDRDLLPHQRVDEGGLARIGRAENGNEAAVLSHSLNHGCAGASTGSARAGLECIDVGE